MYTQALTSSRNILTQEWSDDHQSRNNRLVLITHARMGYLSAHTNTSMGSYSTNTRMGYLSALTNTRMGSFSTNNKMGNSSALTKTRISDAHLTHKKKVLFARKCRKLFPCVVPSHIACGRPSWSSTIWGPEMRYVVQCRISACDKRPFPPCTCGVHVWRVLFSGPGTRNVSSKWPPTLNMSIRRLFALSFYRSYWWHECHFQSQGWGAMHCRTCWIVCAWRDLIDLKARIYWLYPIRFENGYTMSIWKQE